MNSKFQTRLGTLSSWSVFTISWIVGIRLFIALVSDPNRTENYSPLWLVLWLITTVETAAIVLLVMALGLKRLLQRRPSALANILTIGLAGAAANVTVGALANLWGLDGEGIWHIRAVGGFLIQSVLFVFFNMLRGSIIDRNENIRKLAEVEQRLLGYRESARQVINDSIEALRANTIASLSPSIEKISLLLDGKVSNESRASIVQELREVIQNEVRPLSRELVSAAEALNEPSSRSIANPGARPRVPKKFNLRQSLRSIPALMVLVCTFPLVSFLVVDHRSMLRGLISALAVGIVVQGIRFTLPKKREINTRLGVALQVLIAAIGVVPGFFILLGEYGLTQQVIALTIWMACISAATYFFNGYFRAVDAARDRYEAELQAFSDQLGKEVALFEQKLWLERRAWSYVIHGDVQGALSAAVARLQRAENLEPYEFEMVKQDLARAKTALLSSASKEINLSQSLDELVRAWAGVCDIKVELSARAARAIESNRDLRNCINEICKEAISNAVRHGNARQAYIYLNREQDDVLELEVCNEGHTLLRDQKNGMGLQMVEDLSLSWQLTSEHHKGKTCLIAELPISTKN